MRVRSRWRYFASLIVNKLYHCTNIYGSFTVVQGLFSQPILQKIQCGNMFKTQRFQPFETNLKNVFDNKRAQRLLNLFSWKFNHKHVSVCMVKLQSGNVNYKWFSNYLQRIDTRVPLKIVYQSLILYQVLIGKFQRFRSFAVTISAICAQQLSPSKI